MNASVDAVCAVCPQPLALPVVFVPGIMGSRLRQRGGDNVWDPVTRTFLWQYAGAGPAARRRLVIGPTGSQFRQNFLEVDLANLEWMSERVPSDVAQEKLDRGWGGLVWDFYGPFMVWMENNLPQVLGQRDRRLTDVKVEAFAEAYNWTGDNGAAADGLNTRVGQAIAETKALYAASDRTVLKPIVVTHSMGGLVGRAFAKRGSNASKVSAIIHGAMPTQGSPAAYKRLMAGFEGTASVALGITGAQVTAVGANSPGVLELLPSQFHEDQAGRRNWLRFTIEENGTPRQFFSLPKSDPFTEIYKRDDVWWRPVRAEAIDPESPNPLAQELAWVSYLRNLDTARNFHASLGAGAAGFHPNTYMLYADSADFLSWDHVEWRGSTPERSDYGPSESGFLGISSRTVERTAAPDAIPLLEGAMKSKPNQDRWIIDMGFPLGAAFQLTPSVPSDQAGTEITGSAIMQGVSARGDGTVHVGSGIRVPSTIESEATTNASDNNEGYAHDQCYLNPSVRLQVATWIHEEIVPQLRT